eukprot:312985-Prymnesium_polylepis.1
MRPAASLPRAALCATRHTCRFGPSPRAALAPLATCRVAPPRAVSRGSGADDRGDAPRRRDDADKAARLRGGGHVAAPHQVLRAL